MKNDKLTKGETIAIYSNSVIMPIGKDKREVYNRGHQEKDTSTAI